MLWIIGLQLSLGPEGLGGWGSQRVKTEDTSGAVLADWSRSGLLFGGGLKMSAWVSERWGVGFGVEKLLYSLEDDTTLKRGALSIPLSVRYGLPLGGLKPFLGLGLEVLRWDKKYKLGEEELEDSDPDADFLALAELGLSAGLGFLTLEPRLALAYNITPKDADVNEDALKTYEARHYDIRLGLGLLLKLPEPGL